MTPRPYQLDLLSRVRGQCVNGKRIIVVQAATGAGKTVWAAMLTEQAIAKGSKVFFLVHRRRLVNQTSNTLSDFRISHGILMRGESAYSAALCQVGSRDTVLSRCVNNNWQALPQADLVIVDEAHHAADPKSEYRRILEHYPKAIIILLSATPVGADGNGLGPWAQAIECAAPTTQLIADKFLVPLKVFCPDRKKKGKRYIRGIGGDLVESWKDYAEGKPTLLFCSRVQHSKDAVAAFDAEGIAAAHIDASTDDDVRDRAFDNVAAGRVQVLSNVGIVGEGVDVPELGCCQLFCEVNGRVKLMQAAGRIMRPSAGKEYGILIDHSAAVFRHGFPDEDMSWPLAGSADAAFAGKQKDNLTEKAFYCKYCERVYHGQEECPQCGRRPVKPPRSIFAPPPQETTNEPLFEADRANDRGVFAKEEKVRHWLRCLGVSANQNGNFKKASVIYKSKYKEWPGDDFPCNPPWDDRDRKVAEMYPKFLRRKAVAE